MKTKLNFLFFFFFSSAHNQEVSYLYRTIHNPWNQPGEIIQGHHELFMKLFTFAIMEKKIFVHCIPHHFRTSFCKLLKCLRGIKCQSSKVLNHVHSVKHLNNPWSQWDQARPKVCWHASVLCWVRALKKIWREVKCLFIFSQFKILAVWVTLRLSFNDSYLVLNIFYFKSDLCSLLEGQMNKASWLVGFGTLTRKKPQA